MKNKIKYSVILFLSIAICIGMLCALYIDLNYFLTKKEGVAEILKINDTRDHELTYIQLKYHNDFINEMVECTINMKLHDPQSIMEKYKQQNRIKIFYAKNYPYKIYIEGINAPRWLIVVFEISMIMIMFFSIYSCVKALGRK